MLKIENLTGGYVNIPVLKNISFEVADGELVGLIGLNGAGKSTTIKKWLIERKLGLFQKRLAFTKN